MSLGSPYVIGIDLGTTNTAVAYIDTRGEWTDAPEVRVFEVPQLVAPGRVEPRPLLPSFVYLPADYELPAGSLALPWDPDGRFAVGEFARQHGSTVPGRLVSSAKSWLCHGGVDRRAAILPWIGADDVRKISPVDASARILRHIREAWDHCIAQGDSSLQFSEQEVVLTVPASFDEVARELTCEAAQRAGFGSFTLLEEPQAAFYCWIREHQARWSAAMPAASTVLVCDIGGGTTDLSLIRATPGEAGAPPSFERVAVGAHLLLGGDNMDLTLARLLEAKTGRVGSLTARQWSVLAHRCRDAKETLLADEAPPTVSVTVPGATSRLIGGAVSEELDHRITDEVLLDGFFPRMGRDDVERARRAGIQEFGLPFESDPAIPRHVLGFLRSQARNVEESWQEDGLVRPDVLLFNGGATRARRVQERIADVVGSWFPAQRLRNPDWRPASLDNDRPDLSVALGAAYYGIVRRGVGIRIRGGSARAYYLGVGQADGGDSTRMVCLIPHGLEEGREVRVERAFDVVANRAVEFPCWASSTRLQDELGALIDRVDDELDALPPIRTTLRFGKRGDATRLPVQLVARVTEIGTLALSLASTNTTHQWRLEFDLRAGWSAPSDSGAQAASTQGEVLDDAAIEAAQAAVRRVFGEGQGDPNRLMKDLERIWERPRDEWPPSALRALWTALREQVAGRRRSPAHECRWLNLAGFALRPGRGYPGDELRVRDLWSEVYGDGVLHRTDSQPWREWWVLWRRVSAGLTEGQQTQLYGTISPLILSKKVDTFKIGRAAPDPAELQELWFAAASLERLPASSRAKMGDVAIKFLPSKSFDRFGIWALGRMGARIPLYAGANAALAASKVERWLQQLAADKPRVIAANLVDAAQMVRLTGDRGRDVSESTRNQLVALAAGTEFEARITELLTSVVELESAEQAHLLADSLPPGLVLADHPDGE